MRHRREIDGLRAVAVVPVVLFHAGFSVFGGGFAGVDVFFVISGFLITGLLLDEVARTGGVDLGRFYLRRTLRIFPPYYAFLICLAMAAAAGAVAVGSGDVFSAMTYTANYKLDRSWFVGHTLSHM